MMKENIKLIVGSLSSVMPYVAYPAELRELIEKEMDDCDCIGAFVEKFKKKISERCDVTRKTDGQIFLNELRRNLAKTNSD